MIRSVIALALVTNLAHAEVPSDYASGVNLVTEGTSAFYRLALPAEVYAGVAHSDLADMRLFNAEGMLVPFAWLPQPASLREKKPPAALPQFPLYVDRQHGDVGGLALNIVRNGGQTSISVATRDGEATEERLLGGYVLDASALEEPLMALAFALPAAGPPTMHVRVDASDDLANWRTVVTDATLVNLEYAGRRLTRDRVEFPPTKAGYFRLSWSPGRPAMEFTSVKGEFGDRAVEVPRQWREVICTPAPSAESDFECDLGGPFPVDRVAVDLAQVNSVVPAQFFARASPKDPWQPLASAVFYRLQQPGGEISNAPLAIGAHGQRYWLVRIDPRSGGLGVDAPRASFGWQPQEVVFAARGAAPFVLAYGSRAATSGALPIATLVPGYDIAKGLPANIGVARQGAPVPLGGMQRMREPIDTKRWLLWASLVLAAMVLGWMAWRLSREMASGPAADSDPPKAPD
jgi:Protein of unknown function (DUF3999)